MKQTTKKKGKSEREGSGRGLGDILVHPVDGKDGRSKEGRKQKNLAEWPSQRLNEQAEDEKRKQFSLE